MLDGIEGLMNLAAASGEDLGTTADIVTDALTAFGLTAQDSGHFADVLAAASSSANTNVGMMGETFKYAAPIAGALGFSVEDTAEAIGLMANAGIKSSQAGTSLRTIMNNLTGPIDLVGKNLGEVTIETTNADGSMRSLSDILSDCRSAFSQLTESEQAQAAESLVGKNAMSGFLAIMNASESDIQKLNGAITNCTYQVDDIADSLKDSGIDFTRWSDRGLDSGEVLKGMVQDVIHCTQDLGLSTEEVLDYLMNEYDLTADEATAAFELITQGMDNSTGAAQRMAETMQDNLNGQITILKSALQELMIQIGDALMPVIRDIVSHIQSFVEKLQQMDEGTRNTIIRIAAFAAAIGPALVVVGKLTTGIGQGLQAVSSFGKGILTFVNQAKLGVGAGGKLAAAISGISAPVLAVVAAIAVLVAAFVNLWKNNEEFRDKVIAIWDQVKSAFQSFADRLSDLLGGIEINFDTAVGALKKVWVEFCNLLAPIIEGALSAVASVIETVLDVIIGLVQVFKGVFTGDWQMVWDGVKTIFEGIWNGIKGILSSVLEALKGAVNVFLGWFGTNWGNVWNAVKTTFTTIWNAIKSFFEGIWNGLKNTVTTVGSAISTAVSTAWNAVKTTFTTVWNAIKSFFEGIWNGLKNTVTTVGSAISTAVSTAWNAVKTTFTTVWNAIKSFFEGIWNGLKNTVTTVGSAISTAVSTAWNAVKTTFTTVWNAIKSFFEGVWNGIKNTVTTVTAAISTGISTAWNTIKGIFETVWNAISGTVSSAWDTMKNVVQVGILFIKELFSAAFQLLTVPFRLIGRTARMPKKTHGRPSRPPLLQRPSG